MDYFPVYCFLKRSHHLKKMRNILNLKLKNAPKIQKILNHVSNSKRFRFRDISDFAFSDSD